MDPLIKNGMENHSNVLYIMTESHVKRIAKLFQQEKKKKRNPAVKKMNNESSSNFISAAVNLITSETNDFKNKIKSKLNCSAEDRIVNSNIRFCYIQCVFLCII
jgi:type II secretory pathway component HofQ